MKTVMKNDVYLRPKAICKHWNSSIYIYIYIYKLDKEWHKNRTQISNLYKTININILWKFLYIHYENLEENTN